MKTETCPHCGAKTYVEKSDGDLIRFDCGTVFDTDEGVTFERSDDCYEQQIKQQAAEIKELQSALCKYGWHETDCDFLQDELPCSCGFEQLIYPLI